MRVNFTANRYEKSRGFYIPTLFMPLSLRVSEKTSSMQLVNSGNLPPAARYKHFHGGTGNPVLLLHGTFWSRVWLPIMPILAESHQVFALDYPGFGHSDGRLEPEEAAAPALAGFVLRAADALGIGGLFAVAGPDTGGAVA